jgi:RNA polymerase sigma-70 factor (ECF subfamily)
VASNETVGSRAIAYQPEAIPGEVKDLVRHLNAAYNLARWLLRNEADAEDVVQEAYLRAVRSFHTLRGSDSRPWLMGIVRNACYDWQRRTYRMPHQEISPEQLDAIHSSGPSPEAILLQKGESEAVREALASLPPHLREVIILREVEEMSYKEIANVSGIREGTVMSRLSRARRQLARSGTPRRRATAGMA